MKRFKIKTEVCFSENAIDALTEIKGKNAVIFTDSFMASSGAADRIAEKLGNCSSISVFDKVKPDPPIELVTEGLDFLRNANADVVIALGGGSSIDAAKSVVLMAKRVNPANPIRLIAIPTTSGTGSEVTQFAVITDAQKGVKYPLVDEQLLPDMAILDPSLVMTAPPGITADTGFDVITHALEAYVSKNASDASDALAEKSFELAFEFLPRAFKNGTDYMARDKMHSASCLAGMAFNGVSLGVNHSIAHALGGKLHIPHGRANAILLPHVIAFNADLDGHFGADDTEAAVKYAKLAQRVGLPCTNVRMGVLNLIQELTYMMQMMHIPMTLSEMGIDLEEFELIRPSIVEAALADVCTLTNPKRVSAKRINRILDTIAR